VGDKPVRGRFESGGGQGAAEIGFVEPDDTVAGRRDVRAKPTEGQLVLSGQ
jgi:hypothetical protein